MSSGTDHSAKGPEGERKATKSHRELMRSLWLPLPEAPANDNDRGVLWAVYVLFRRHMNWLLPTALLAAFSLIVLNLNHPHP